MRAKAHCMKLVLLLSGLSLSAAADARVFGIADLKRDTVEADPISGLRWLRVGDPSHPAAPPKLVLLRSDQGVPKGEQRFGPHATRSLCVHAGDHLRLDAAGTAWNSMTLDAVSVGNAACGDPVRARLAVTGKLVAVTVTRVGAGVLLGAPGVSR
ncbi:MAG: hypothetical protein QOH85_2009 [Acidobacteriaceae bacterium]|nr:hypothetical protein [Acidobacteriaceae bacterium]